MKELRDIQHACTCSLSHGRAPFPTFVEPRRGAAVDIEPPLLSALDSQSAATAIADQRAVTL